MIYKLITINFLTSIMLIFILTTPKKAVASEARLYDDASDNYISLTTPTTVDASYTFSLPATDAASPLSHDGTSGLVLENAHMSATKFLNDVIVDNANQLKLFEQDSNGVSYIGIKAPDSVTANITFTLPNDDADQANKPMVSSTAGVLTWADNINVTTDFHINAVEVMRKPEAYGEVVFGGGHYFSENTVIGMGAVPLGDANHVNTVIIGAEANANVTKSGGNAVIAGYMAGHNSTTVQYNVCMGAYACEDHEDTADNTVFIGFEAGQNGSATTGDDMVAIGHSAGKKNEGTKSVFIGYLTGDAATTGESNIAVGYEAFGGQSTGTDNFAFGQESLEDKVDGNMNVAFGYQAGKKIKAGSNNVCIGYQAGDALITGTDNIFIGNGVDAVTNADVKKLNINNSLRGDMTNHEYAFGAAPTSGYSLWFDGVRGDFALDNQAVAKFYDDGSSNFIGLKAPASFDANVVFTLPDSAGSNDQAIQTDGSGTLSFVDVNDQMNPNGGNIDGSLSIDGSRDTIQLRIQGFTGQAKNLFEVRQEDDTDVFYIDDVGGAYALGDVYPMTDSTLDLGSGGQRWDNIYATNGTLQTSDGRKKSNIADSDLGLNFIKQIKPVSYQWKNSKNKPQKKHHGIIAQEVEQLAPHFAGIKHTPDADIYGAQYSQFIAPIVKALQEINSKLILNEKLIAEEKALYNEILELKKVYQKQYKEMQVKR